MSRKNERALRLATWKQRVAHVFKETEKILKENAERARSEHPTATYIAASYMLLRGLVSKAVADRYTSADGSFKGRNATFLGTIGETLFEMRDSASLAEFCDRMASRDDPRAAFFEAFVARMFLDLRYAIVAIGERKIKGEDFDFTAIGQGGFICAEVTCLDSQPFNPKTIKNALEQKIGQVPADAINAVFIVLPEGWMIPSNIPTIRQQVIRVLNVSKRVNMVYFLGEQNNTVETETGPIDLLQFRCMPIFHKAPRTPCDALRLFIIFSHGGKDVMADGLPEESELLQIVGRRPFFQWVDDTIGRPL